MSKSEQVQANADAGASLTPTPRAASARDLMLLDFLRQYDAVCPVCGYNLKGLTRPICPECGEELTLTVGAMRHPIGWLLAALAPGFFSGIAAFFVLVPIVARLFFGDGALSVELLPLDFFGWCSGLFAIILAAKRHRFLAQSLTQQRRWALAIWLIHIAALGLFIFLAAIYF